MAAELTVMHNYWSKRDGLWTLLSGFLKKQKNQKKPPTTNQKKTTLLVKSDLRREGGKKNKKNRVLEHMRSSTTPGNA